MSSKSFKPTSRRSGSSQIRRAVESLESRRLMDGSGLLAQYYNTTDLTGTPVTRMDANVNFNWTNGAPDNALNPDNYTARWTGQVQPTYSQTYTFSVNVTGGTRLWVNGTQLINQWAATGTNTFTGTIALTAGTKYSIQLEYAEKTGNAAVSLSWSSASQASQVIPRSALYSWSDTDLGTPGTAGSSSFNSSTGVMTVSGAGNSLLESGDSGHLVYQQVTGDMQLIARVSSISGGIAGVNIRESLATGAKSQVVGDWGGTIYSASRITASTNPYLVTQQGVGTPAWVKVVRVGNTLSGYYSTDGTNWMGMWGRNISMGSTIYVGLVVSSTTSSLATATFDNINLSTYQSDYTTSWIGNNFNGAGQWVQNDIKGIYVDPANGTIFTNSPWDEGGHEAAAYQNGQNLGGYGDLHGWQRSGGWAIVADADYVYLTMSQGNLGYTATGYPTPGTNWNCIRRYNRASFTTAGWSGGSGWDSSMVIVNTSGSALTGLAIIGNNLYVSDPTTNQVKIYNKTTMASVGAFTVARPGQMTVDGSGNLWVVSYSDASNAAKILCYNSSGTKLTPEITGVVSPMGIGYNPATGQLLVTDDGPRQQVLKYSNLTNAAPTLAGTLGDNGGIASGTAGVVTPTKFDNPMAVAADSSGNIYVSFQGIKGNYVSGLGNIGLGAVIRSFNSSSALNWELRGLEFVDSAALDPNTDGLDLYTKDEHFTLSYATSGVEMGTWVGRTVDESTNATDPRLSGDGSSVWIKNLGGQTFMLLSGQGGMTIRIYKKVAGTELWKWCAAINEPSQNGSSYTTVWRDTNNDGLAQSSEYANTNLPLKEDGYGFDVDSQGNIWSAGYDTQPRKYSFTGLDGNGNPIYSTTVQQQTQSTIFTRLARVAYDAATDTMYASGWTAANPGSSYGWGLAGTTLARYNNWSSGGTLAWSTLLPYNESNNNIADALSLAGNRIFVSFCSSGDVCAYDTTTGALVRNMNRGPEVAGLGGWLDTSQPMNAFRRSNGEYVITVEDDLLAKITVMRAGGIKPTGLTATAASGSQINLSWSDNNNKESGFVVQRSTDGTNFSDIATLPANMTSYSATGLSAGTTYYFRVRANNSFDNSPWSTAASATTQTAIPAAPSSLAATAASSSQINLTWTDNSSNETGFAIDRATDSGFTANMVTNSVAANVASYSATGLSASTTYYFRVRATGSSGNSANSATASATTQAAIPAAPSNLTATAASSSQINLAWTDNSSNETGFSIDRATNSGFTTGLVTTSVGANVTSSNITGLSASTTYYFRVRATGSSGNSAYTSTASATTQATGSAVQLTGTIIGAGGVYGNDPNNTRAAALDGNVSTFYDADTATGAWLGYDLGTAKQITQVKYAPRASWGSRMVGGVLQGSNTSDFSSGVVTLFTIASAPAEGSLTTQTVTDTNTYRYVRYLGPTNGYCNVAEVQFFGPASAPTAPSGLGATAVSSSQINLSWTDNSSNETGFSIDRATNSTFTTGLVTTTVGAGVTSSNITGLSASTTYYFRVKATGSSGDSAYTSTASATTQAPTSAQLTGTSIGTGGSYGDNPATTRDAALDGNLSTFFDAQQANGAWVGLDLGTAKTITSIKYAPRASWGSRMVGGVFQVSNTADFSSGVTTIYTIASAPTEGVLTTQSVSVSGTYRYVRYLSPNNGYGNVAEVQFFGY